VPDNETLRAALVALVDTLSLAYFVPVTLGEKLTPIVQDAPGASKAGQSLDCA
jgi:hypothetical protein